MSDDPSAAEPSSTPPAAPEPLSADKSERAVARRAAGGDGQAWAELVEGHWHRVVTLHRMATGDARAAEQLAVATFEEARRNLDAFLRDDEPFQRWIACSSRDTARSCLAADDYQATPWGQAEDLLSDPPQARALAQPALHEGSHVPEEDLREALSDLSMGHRLFARLVFHERLEPGRLAGVLGASSAFVVSFVYGILDQLGGLEHLELADQDGPGGIGLAREVLEAQGDHDALKELLRRHAECSGSRTLIFRSIRLAEALGKDLEPVATPPAALLEELRSAPGVVPAAATPDGAERPPPPKVIPLSVRPRARGNRDRRMQAGFAATILLFFLGGSYALFGDKALAPRFRAAGLIADLNEAEQVPEEHRAGEYRTLTGRSFPLPAGKTLFASPLGPTGVTLAGGARITLLGASGLRAASGTQVALLRGRLVARLEDVQRQGGELVVQAGGVVARAGSGRLAVSGTQDGAVVVAVKGGPAQVRLADGTDLALEPFRQVRVLADGTYRIEDAPAAAFTERADPETGQVAALGVPAAAAGTSGVRAGSGNAAESRIPTSGPFGGGGAAGLGASSPATGGGAGGRRVNTLGNGVMTSGNRGRPGTVRGFRDAF
jgi:DNA-directed RNA polymerase specialized sigma24 family protein